MTAWWRRAADEHGSAMDVVLDGDATVTGAREVDQEDEGDHDGVASGTRRTRRRGRLAAAAVLVVVGLGVAQVVDERRTVERAAGFAAMPGTVASVSAPPSSRWVEVAEAGAARAGHLVLLTTAGETPSVRAVGVADGVERWVRERPERTSDRCFAERGQVVVETVVCWRTPVRTVLETRRGRAEATVFVLDAEDGTVLAERSIQVPSHAPALTGDDVVTAHARRDHLLVTREGVRDGEPRWSVEVPTSGHTVPPGTGGVRVEHGLVVVQGAVTAVLRAEDGELLGVWYPGGAAAPPGRGLLDGADVRVLPSGFGVWGAPPEPGDPPGAWFDPDGGRLAELPGPLVEPLVSDGSRPQLVLAARTDEQRLSGVDVTSGEIVWEAPTSGALPVVRRDGVVVLLRGEEVAALDLRDGAVRWTRPVTGLRPNSGHVTDGSVLVVVSEQGRTTRLVAVDLDTGEPVWEGPVPEIAPRPGRQVAHDLTRVWIGEVGGHAVLVGQDVVVGLA